LKVYRPFVPATRRRPERRDHTNGPAPTQPQPQPPTLQVGKGMRAHTPGVSTSFGHLASGSAQLSASAPATRRSDRRDHTNGPAPTPTPTSNPAISVRTTPTPHRESNDLLASLVNTLSAAAAATAAAGAATTDKLKTAAVVAAIADTLADYQAIRPPPEIRRRGGRPPRKTPSRPRAHRQPRPSDDRGTTQERWMAAAPSCTWVDCPTVWGWTMILHWQWQGTRPTSRLIDS
jgi:hypothetical protein